MTKYIDTYKIVKAVVGVELKQLEEAIKVLGRDFTFGESDDECPCVGMQGGNCISNPFDLIVRRIYINDNGTLMFEGHVVEGEDAEFVADEVIPGHIPFILGELPDVEIFKQPKLTKSEILVGHLGEYIDVAQEMAIECVVKMQELDVCNSDRQQIKQLIRDWAMEFMVEYGNYDYQDNPEGLSYYDLIDGFLSKKMKQYE